MLAKAKTVGLIVLLFLPILIIPEIGLLNQDDSNPLASPSDENDSDNVDSDIVPRPDNGGTSTPGNAFDISSTSMNGIIDPVDVEQRGYYASGNYSARTDTGENVGTDLLLDTDRNWVADEAEIALWNLEKLYAVNGSFSEGTPGTNVNPSGGAAYHPVGWDATSTDTATFDDDVQIAGYDDSGREYITVESQGGKVGQNAFGHATGTNILWTQEMENAPYTENFNFSFSYFYLRGPIDGATGLDPVSGNCTLTLYINGTNVWNMSLLLVSQRGVWIDSGNIPITVSGAPSALLFEFGLVIDEYLELDKRDDYDGDPENLADGIGNAAYITVYLDDISFIKSVSPTPAEVDLKYVRGSSEASFTGTSSLYNATITNSTYWNTSPVSVEVQANTSVSFEYEARLLSHRFIESNWQTDISDYGVAYSVINGSSPELRFYSYVGYLGDYEDPQVIITYPDDWENASISDPFLIDLTSSCIIQTGNITVPSSILDRLGWWQFDLDAPNYAKSIDIQKYDSTEGWLSAINYRVGNETRPSIEIGTITEIPPSLSNVNISWYLPNGTIWYEETVSGGIDGSINGTSKFLDNSLAGHWKIEYVWSNGTEVAYRVGSFYVYHSSSLVSLDSLIETDAGETIVGRVRFQDLDNGAYLMEDAVIKANWSGSLLTFDPNPTRNWWEVDLDTAVVGAGLFLVEVNATLSFYDTAYTQFNVLVTNVTRLTSPNSPWTSATWEDLVSLTFNYESYDSQGSSWIPVTNTSLDVIATVNWTVGSWSISETGTDGIYEMIIDTSANPVGSYLLNISFSKPSFQTKQLVLTLVVSPQTSSLNIFNGSSTTVDIEDVISLKMNYTDSSGNYVGGATVTVDDVSPSSGLSFSSIDPVSGETGNYSVDITVNGLGVYTIRFLASKDGYQNATGVYVIVVNDIPTSLNVTSGESVDIGIFESFNATYHFEMENGTPIEGAQLNVLFSGPTGGLSWLAPVDEGSGNYSVEFSSTVAGAYLITVATSKQYYQSDAVSFFLSVGEITTQLDILNGTADTIDFNGTYHLVLSYYNTTPYGLSSADVTIESISPSSGLDTGVISDDGGGFYSLDLDPYEVGIFTIVFQATLDNHQNQFASFTLSVNDIIANATISSGNSAEIGLSDTFDAKLFYQDYNGTGILGATVDVFYSGPSGLEWTTPLDEGTGNYSMTFSAVSSGTYLITISADKDDYQATSGYFFLLVGEITTQLDVLNGTAETIDFGETYRLVLSYYNTTPYGLVGADVEIVTVSPSSGLDSSVITDEGGGLYSLILDPQIVDIFSIVFRANLSSHQTQFTTFTLNVNDIRTNLTILTGNNAEIGLTDSFEARVFFEAFNGSGITGASINIFYSGPSGLSWTTPLDESTGNYSMTFNAVSSGTYLITISAIKEDYQTSSTYFFLLIGDITTHLDVLNGTSITINFGETYRLVLSYYNNSMYGLAGANVSILSITPSSGLQTTSITDEGSGLYSLILNPQVDDTFTILFSSNLTNHQTQFTTFTLVSNPVPTELKILNSTTSLIVQSNFTLYFRYETESLVGIPGGFLSVSSIPTGLTLSDFEDVGNGYYRLYIFPTSTGSFQFTVTSSKQFYQPESASVFAVVGEIVTELSILNGTADNIAFGESYELFLNFVNGTSYGLEGAVFSFVSISPSGLPAGIFVDEGGGLYSVLLTPTLSNTYSLIIRANLTNHEIKLATFTLVVEATGTVLQIMNATTTISVDGTYDLTLLFEDAENNGIEGAAVESINPPDGIDLSSVVELGNGYYRINLDPKVVGVFNLIFKASLENYQNASTAYILESSLIPTILEFSGNATSGSTYYGALFEISIAYQRTDLTANVTSAILNVTVGSEEIQFAVEEIDGVYRIAVLAESIGIHVITIEISKDDHVTQIATYTLTVLEIPTLLSWANIPEEIAFNRTHIISFSYSLENESVIPSSSLEVIGSKNEWATVYALGDGLYNISVKPEELGTYTLTFRFTGAGLETQAQVISFTVVSVGVEVRILSNTSILESDLYRIIVELVEAGTDNMITDAILQCKVKGDPNADWVTLQPVPTIPGRYLGDIPLAEVTDYTQYTIEFYLNKINHQIVPASIETTIGVSNNVVDDVLTVVRYGGSGFVIILIAIVAYRFTQKKKRQRNLRAIAVKQRFDDVKNMIGIIILHKKSGLPVFSKTLKGGFDESMVSAFITAVSHFRNEFGMDEKHWDFQVIPISDIISAVPTRNLICAFITGSQPSKEQMIKMEAFGRAIGAMFDDSTTIAPTQVVDEHTESIFTALFMDMMDGEFLTAYKKREAVRLPRSMSCLSSVVGRMEDDEFTIDELARGMAMCGIEEGEAYLQVMDAIENEFIKPANGSKPLDPDKELNEAEILESLLDKPVEDLEPPAESESITPDEPEEDIEPVEEAEEVESPDTSETKEVKEPPKSKDLPKPPDPLEVDDFSDYDDLRPPDPE